MCLDDVEKGPFEERERDYMKMLFNLIFIQSNIYEMNNIIFDIKTN